MPIGIDLADGVNLNTDVLYETAFPITEVKRNETAYEMMGNPSPITLRRLARGGRRSPITKEVIRLEVAVGSTGQLYTSVQACRRFLERLNGNLK